MAEGPIGIAILEEDDKVTRRLQSIFGDRPVAEQGHEAGCAAAHAFSLISDGKSGVLRPQMTAVRNTEAKVESR
ncbi:hypothetical protein L0V05_11395 [Tabrizicola sp. J26]|uniref:hypothetical protein n=1 Tax=Alitabrizicola rongguiensis TaxID=2909234 RepID=UPI001F33142E|nr:hypothetical protein [Tabrizicola rongguiensis]MCF1709424.1 hypothetical protein [Tabrizicola rongguiensis]